MLSSSAVQGKSCSQCLEAKPLDQFSRRSASRDGLAYWCRACVAAYHRARRDGAERSDATPLPLPNAIDPLAVAWLAGLMDGEGSIGIQANSGGGGLVPAIQLNMTCQQTVEHASRIISELGAMANGFSGKSRVPEKHKPFWSLRVGRLRDCSVVAQALLPHAVTKRGHWSLMEEFTRSRLQGRTINPLGKALNPRRSPGYKHLTEEEWEIYEALKELNRRGPAPRIDQS